MKVLLQRVSAARVRVDGEEVASIGKGLLLLVGVASGDGLTTAAQLAAKTAQLRVFPDDTGRFDLSLLETAGEALVVSQFTLLADTRRGRRPSFTDAAAPETAAQVVQTFGAELERLGVKTSQGQFGAHMQLELVNDGPVTIMLEA